MWNGLEREGRREGGRELPERRRLVPLNGSDRGGGGGDGDAGKEGESSLVIGSERRQAAPSPATSPPFYRFLSPPLRPQSPLPAPRPPEREIRCTRNGIPKYDDRKMQFSEDLCQVARHIAACARTGPASLLQSDQWIRGRGR